MEQTPNNTPKDSVPLHEVHCSLSQEILFEFQKNVAWKNIRSPKVGIWLVLYLVLSVVLILLITELTWRVLICILLLVTPLTMLSNMKKQSRAIFRSLYSQGKSEYDLRFFADCFETSMPETASRTDYSSLVDIRESKHAFFLMQGPQAAIVVPKRVCSLEMMTFLRSLKK